MHSIHPGNNHAQMSDNIQIRCTTYHHLLHQCQRHPDDISLPVEEQTDRDPNNRNKLRNSYQPLYI